MANEATINGVHVHDVQLGRVTRKSFARIPEILDMPNLIEVQKNSYEWFLKEGLREVFDDADAITDYTGNLELSFIDYRLDDQPKYRLWKSARNVTQPMPAPLRVRTRLLNKETGEIKEQELFMGDFPLHDGIAAPLSSTARSVSLSPSSSVPRACTTAWQLRQDRTRSCCTSTVIPNRGAWLEYETDSNDVFYVRIDKNRKIPMTVVHPRASAWSTDAEILENASATTSAFEATLEKDPSQDRRKKALLEIYRKLRPGEPPTVETARRAMLNALFFDARRYDLSAVGRYKYNKKLNISQPHYRPQAGARRSLTR